MGKGESPATRDRPAEDCHHARLNEQAAGSLLLYLDRDKTGKPSDDGALIVEIPVTTWHRFERRQQEQLAASRFEEVRQQIGALVDADGELRNLIAHREITLELVDDYGNGAVRLATLVEGRVRLD